jgi:hypothetical protein
VDPDAERVVSSSRSATMFATGLLLNRKTGSRRERSHETTSPTPAHGMDRHGTRRTIGPRPGRPTDETNWLWDRSLLHRGIANRARHGARSEPNTLIERISRPR